jgi:hypothetical protein
LGLIPKLEKVGTVGVLNPKLEIKQSLGSGASPARNFLMAQNYS